MHYSSKKKGFLFWFFCLIFLLFFTKTSYAATFFYPMNKYKERQTVKAFGQLITDQFYIGNEKLFPYNRFYGYHTGVDLESFTDEKNKPVPVYAISSGTITYVGNLSGYGGVILEKLDGENTTALYGHVKIKETQFKIGEHLSVDEKPVLLTYLGEEFSSETSKERKHLHFGIYRGTNLYFHGHEKTYSQLAKKWYDPSVFLQERQAKEPKIEISSIPITGANKNVQSSEKKSSIFQFIQNLINYEFRIIVRAVSENYKHLRLLTPFEE